MSLSDEIELLKFQRGTLRGDKNLHRRPDALRRLFEQPISDELAGFLRKVRLAELLEAPGESFEEMRSLSDWEVERLERSVKLRRGEVI